MGEETGDAACHRDTGLGRDLLCWLVRWDADVHALASVVHSVRTVVGVPALQSAADDTACHHRAAVVIRPNVELGEVISVPEADYMYGVGTLTLKVTAIGDVVRHGGADWVALRGIQLRAGTTVPGERFALVRVTALAARPSASAATPEGRS